ncbi:helix-turn-helix domain-containing protein [Micromonospora lutea]|uniref:HTH cro/C1-type domain-containing protein n=1 Tax=Micromonospora lutea TaxID=419825 RepID=A0ABQ4IX79_9ACTN|nr:helix-turn-helix transcriptional regulator [Micromonospora lutea]GIJ22519.1 hypothetical protein Vlu01_31430 [Micromonospora lutea]
MSEGRTAHQLPVGRRVAQWRIRRNMTQQQFADRIGKSKSWVDKIERGVRRLERVSNLREIADALRIDVQILLPERPGRPGRPARASGVERLRAALARYHVEVPPEPLGLAQLRAGLDHAWQSYRHARYPVLLDSLPGLLDATRQAQAARFGRVADELLMTAYGLVALVLVKVGQGESAWLAADRGMAVAQATGDPRLTGVATIPLAQALRAVGRRRSALDAALVAARRVAPSGDPANNPTDIPLRGTLLLQAGLAAGGLGDGRYAVELLGKAAALAPEQPGGTSHGPPGRLGNGPLRVASGGLPGGLNGGELAMEGILGVSDGTGFGASVEAARVLVEIALGDTSLAAARHERLVTGAGWWWLSAEHRAAYLLDVARAYARIGEMTRAGRALLEADSTARGEVRDRPAARELLQVVARSAAAPAGLARLAATLHTT